MISGRRRALALAGAALVGGAVIGALLLSGNPKPVDVRQVQSSFGPEQMISATYTTSVLGVGPTTTVPPPPPPVATTAAAQTTEPLPTAGTRTSESKQELPPWLRELGGCDDDYRVDGTCVPWLFPLLVDECEWLREHGSVRIEVRGKDRHELDLNLDGIACGDGDR